jgi:hypothetical protein
LSVFGSVLWGECEYDQSDQVLLTEPVKISIIVKDAVYRLSHVLIEATGGLKR